MVYNVPKQKEIFLEIKIKQQNESKQTQTKLKHKRKTNKHECISYVNLNAGIIEFCNGL